AKDCRTEMPRAGGGQHRAPVARIEHDMVDDMSEEVGTIDPPRSSRRIAIVDERALAGADEDCDLVLAFAGTRRGLPSAARPLARIARFLHRGASSSTMVVEEANICPRPGMTPDGDPDRCRSTTPCGFRMEHPTNGRRDQIKCAAPLRRAFVGRGGEGGI